MNNKLEALKTLTLRRAKPSDVEQIVALMHESSPHVIDYSFGCSASKIHDFLAYDFKKGKGVFGYRNQFVAESAEGKIIATATAYQGRKINSLTLHTMLSAFIHFRLIDFFKIILRMPVISKLFIKPRSDSIYLANCCVASSYRSKGIFPELEKYAIKQTSDARIKVIQLDVSTANHRALKLYESLGYKIIATRHYKGKDRIDGFRRLEKPMECAVTQSTAARDCKNATSMITH